MGEKNVLNFGLALPCLALPDLACTSPNTKLTHGTRSPISTKPMGDLGCSRDAQCTRGVYEEVEVCVWGCCSGSRHRDAEAEEALMEGMAC